MNGRRSRTLGLAATIALIATACSWGQAGGNAARNAANPFEVSLTRDNVDQLELAWHANGLIGEPVTNNKYLYTTTFNGFLHAYAAGGPASPAGATRCSGSPSMCTPVWFARVSAGNPGIELALDGDKVFAAGWSDGEWQLSAVDADPASCPATANGCVPAWIGCWGAPASSAGSLSIAVSDGRVYVLSPPDTVLGDQYVVVFDERGMTNCTSGPPRTCRPLFRAHIGSNLPVVPAMAVAAGRIFISRVGPQTLVFDAAGQAGCSNGTCSPIYGLATAWDVSVSDTTAYGTSGATLKAFDATGATGCAGAPRVCQPKWTAVLPHSLEFGDAPTISNGTVLVAQTEFRFTEPGIEAFDAAGIEGCTGSPAVCQPLWTVNWLETPGETNRLSATPSLLIANGWTVRPSPPSMTQTLKIFDLAGITSCGGAPKLCTALATVPVGNDRAVSRPTVAFGRIALTDTVGLKVFAVPANPSTRER